MNGQARMGYGPKIIVGIQDTLPDGTKVVKAYAGVVIEGEIRVDYETTPMSLGMYVTEMPTGRKRIHLDVVFDLHEQGVTMKTWADIQEPTEIEN